MEEQKERALIATLEEESEKLDRLIHSIVPAKAKNIDCWRAEELPSTKRPIQARSTRITKPQKPALNQYQHHQEVGHSQTPQAIATGRLLTVQPLVSDFRRKAYRIQSLVTDDRFLKKGPLCCMQTRWRTPLSPRGSRLRRYRPRNSLELLGPQLFAPSRVLRSSAGSRWQTYQ